MEMVKVGLLILISIVGGYIVFRVLAMAIFKSWFDVKNQHRKELDDESDKDVRGDGGNCEDSRS